MRDIYDIKDVLLSFPINITYSLIYLIFLLILFIIYKNLLNKNIDNIIEDKIEIIKPEKDYYEILEKFKNEYLDKNEKIFYSKLLYILRDILEYK
jgi:hypothetical protein